MAEKIQIFTSEDSAQSMLVLNGATPFTPLIFGARKIIEAEDLAKIVIDEQGRRSNAGALGCGDVPTWTAMAEEAVGTGRFFSYERLLMDVQSQVTAAQVFAQACGEDDTLVIDNLSPWVKAACRGVLPAYATAVMTLKTAAPTKRQAQDALDSFNDLVSENWKNITQSAWAAASDAKFTLKSPVAFSGYESDSEMIAKLDHLEPWWTRNASNLNGARLPASPAWAPPAQCVEISTAIQGAQQLEKTLGALHGQEGDQAPMVADLIGYGPEWRWFVGAALRMPRTAIEASSGNSPCVAKELSVMRSQMRDGRPPDLNNMALPPARGETTRGRSA